jgi:hypothetical protein
VRFVPFVHVPLRAFPEKRRHVIEQPIQARFVPYQADMAGFSLLRQASNFSAYCEEV